jgi:hypothetical protein
MSNFNPIAKLKSVHWDTYQKAAWRGQIAAGALVVITAVALTIIFVTHAHTLYIAANYYHAITALEVVGALSLAIFAVCSCMHYLSLRNRKQDLKNENFLERRMRNKKLQGAEKPKESQPNAPSPGGVTPPLEPEPPRLEEKPLSPKAPPLELPPPRLEEKPLSPKAPTLEQEPIKYIKEKILQPILKAGEGALENFLTAYIKQHNFGLGLLGKTLDLEETIGKMEKVFQEGETLRDRILNDPQTCVSELLCYFGRGKKKPSFVLRELIAAFNSGDAAKLEEVTKEYKAVCCGHDFTAIATAFKEKSKDDAALLGMMPKLLVAHFSLSDDHRELKEVGQEILVHIFDGAHAKKNILNAFGALRRKVAHSKSSKEIIKSVEQFVQLVLDEAHLSPERYKPWNDKLIKHMLDKTFKKQVRHILGMIASNIGILKQMFGKGVKEKILLIGNTSISLLERGDCSKKTDLVDKMCELQTKLNGDKETNRIALVALPADDTRDYNTLQTEVEVIRLCCEANKNFDFQQLIAINQNTEVTDLEREYHVRLVAVPRYYKEVGLKKAVHKKKDAENWLNGSFGSVVAWALPQVTSYIIGQLKDDMLKKFLQLLPAIAAKDLRPWKVHFEKIFDLLMKPLLDGLIGSDAFSKTFEQAIRDNGEKLEQKVHELLLLSDEALTFERIRDVVTDVIGGIAKSLQSSEPVLNPLEKAKKSIQGNKS